ncbi:MAG: hypothetical protein ACK5XN_31160 [Bacteroidota bacterium]|jgi:hypothetical protein
MQLQLDFNAAPAYHNTTGLKGSQLQEETRNAISQELQVVNFFQAAVKSKPWQQHFTPEEVWEGTDITHLHSVRRAISVLKKRGILVKTIFRKVGNFGKPVHAYTWNQDPETNPLIAS